MASPTSSQRLSFTQLVLDMGLADKKALLTARKLIKKRKAEGKKLTVARACVKLEILTERQAKKVQLELKRLKTGFASSEEFRPPDTEDEPKPKKKAKKKEKKPKADKDEAADEAEAKTKDDDADEPKAKKSKKDKKAKKSKKTDDDADADADDEPEPKPKKTTKKAAKAKAEEVEEADSEEATDSEDEATDSEEEATDSEEKAADSEEETDSLEVEEDSEDAEEEEPKAKAKKAPVAKKGLAKGKGKAPSKAKAPAKRQKAKLGKEIVLDSQRAEKLPKRKRRGVGAIDGAPEARPASKGPLLAIGGSVVALLLIMVGSVVFMGDAKDVPEVSTVVVDTPDDGDDTGGSESTGGEVDRPAVESRPKPIAGPKAKRLEAERQVEQLSMKADDQAAEGKFSEAIETLEGFPADLRGEKPWLEVGERDLKKYRALLPVQEEFEAAVSAASDGDTDKLLALLTKIQSEDYEYSDESFVSSFHKRSKEAVGEDGYDELIAAIDDAAANESADAVDAFEEDEDENTELQTRKELEVETRGTPERRTKFRGAIPTYAKNLKSAQKTLSDRAAARKKRVKAQAKKVLKSIKKTEFTIEGLGKVKVVEYREDGFSVKGKKGVTSFGWGNCPPSIGHKIKKLAADTKDADAIFELGMYAVRRAQFELAKRDFQHALKLKPALKSKLPNLGSLEQLTKVFRGKNSISKGDESEVVWAFDSERPQEAMDFKGIAAQLKVELIGGQLKVTAPPNFFVVGANVRGGWKDRATISATLASSDPPPGLIVESKAGMYVVQFGQKTEIYDGWGPQAKVKASSETRATGGAKVSAEIKRKGADKADLIVRVGTEECLKFEIPLDGEISFKVGARGNGEVRFGEVRARGMLSEKWIERTKAAMPNEINRELDEAKRKEMASKRGGMQIPVAYMKTSAEDDVGFGPATPSQRTMIIEGRKLLEQANQYGAFKKFEDAASDYRFHVANYLYALGQINRDPQGAVIRLRRCVKGVEDFYEAQVALSKALFRVGHHEKAEAMLEKALELRPDFAPGYQARSQLQTVRGQYDKALATLELAEVLGPGDPTTTALKGRVIALAEGPAWAVRKRSTTNHYNLDTDMVDWADRFVTQLESIRLRYEEAYPILMNPDAPERKASVLIFGAAEGYYQYSERTSGDRSENTLGHFSPSTGQLLLFLEEDPSDWNSYHVIFHEGMHQWCHSNGLSLPFWANEGMAEYVGGTRLSEDGSTIEERGAIDSFLKQRLRNLTANWKQRLTWQKIMTESPQEFYAGNAPLKYAQAWTMIHFMMESGFVDGEGQELKKTFEAYLQHFKEVSLDEKRQAQGGAKLEYIYVDTFHQLDMEKVTEAWEKWVEKLASKMGMRWTVPDDEDE